MFRMLDSMKQSMIQGGMQVNDTSNFEKLIFNVASSESLKVPKVDNRNDKIDESKSKPDSVKSSEKPLRKVLNFLKGRVSNPFGNSKNSLSKDFEMAENSTNRVDETTNNLTAQFNGITEAQTSSPKNRNVPADSGIGHSQAFTFGDTLNDNNNTTILL